MPRVTDADLGRATSFLASARAGTPAAPIPRATLAGLRELIGADEAEYFELRRDDRGVVALETSHDYEAAPGTDEGMALYGHQNPLVWRRGRPGDGPMRLSERITSGSLRRLDFYEAVMRPNGLTDTLKVWLHRDRGSIACVQLWRRGGAFSDRQQNLLGVLHSHLIGLRAEGLEGRAEPVSPVALTRREAEVLSWAVRGATDAEIAGRLGVSAATVGKHLEHAFASLGVHTRSEAAWRLARLAAGGVSGLPGRWVVGSDGDHPH